jgi:hypothetical protein
MHSDNGQTGERIVKAWTIIVGLGLLFLVATPAAAYVGPGAGVSVIGAALALIAGAVLAIVGFVWYPIKRLVRYLRQGRSTPQSAPADRV